MFAGEVGTCFRRSLDGADAQGKGLRVRLRLGKAPQLADVPWEYLYPASLRRFLVLSTKTPVVRYLEQPRAVPPLTVTPPLQVLVMVCSPTNLATLDVDAEVQRIRHALAGLEQSGQVQLTVLPHAHLADLRGVLHGAPDPVVPGAWRDADAAPGPRDVPVPVLCRARRDRAAARRGPRGPGDRARHRPVTVDDLEGAAPQRGHQGGKLEYRASVAQWKAELVARRPKTAKLAADERLREYVQERLSGTVRRKDGTAVAGPTTKAWKGRNKPRRQDRRWALSWSPEQISARLKVDFPDDPSMRVSHEAIYQALFVQGRGTLARELTACLRTGRALRVPRARVGQHAARASSTTR